jgi:ATP-binding cassette subfamily B protein
MDEISSGLDSELESALRDLIKFFQSRSITIIVTHRLETILKSDQLLLLDQGRVEALGPHEHLKQIPQYQNFLKHLN